jgi:hypothetical protein
MGRPEIGVAYSIMLSRRTIVLSVVHRYRWFTVKFNGRSTSSAPYSAEGGSLLLKDHNSSTGDLEGISREAVEMY